MAMRKCRCPSVQVIVQARKPEFFNYNMSLYEVVTEDGLMRPVMTGENRSQDVAACDRAWHGTSFHF